MGDALADKFAGDSSVLIADVDCTVEQDLCGTYGVSGYPTIKYFKAEKGFETEDYNGGRDASALEKFVVDNLSLPCSADNQEKCSEKQKEYIKKMSSKSEADLKKELERLNKMAAAKVEKSKKAWLDQRKALLPSIIKA